jgi:hypothetical protein
MASSPASPFGSSSPFSPETNPFLAPAKATEDAPTGYAMIPAGPALDASEVESSELATEILVRWDDTILHVGHLAAGRAFAVGEVDGCDLTIPAERLGHDKLPVVVAEGATSVAVIPPGAQVTIEIAGRKLDLAAATAEAIATPSAHLAGASAVRLAQGMRITTRTSGFVFEVACVFAGKRVAGKTSGDKKSFAAQALSFGLHGALVAAMFAFMPTLTGTDDAELTQDQAHLLSAALKAQAEKDMKEEQEKAKEQADAEAQSGSDTGMASPGEPGKMGKVNAPQANRHYAVAGNEKERALSRQAALEDAQNFGFAGMLASMQQDDPNAPTSPWSNGSIGMDSMTANGNMWGALPGDSFGYGGLALSGGGEGAGGLGHGVGMGLLDTAGHGLGTCNSVTGCSGFGSARLGRGHDATKTGKMRVTDTKVSGRIPPEVIQRVVRQNFGRFRACYEAGLRNNPSLQGRVAVSFVVGRDGSVGSAQSAGSDLPDAGVVSCVVKQFYGLSFPAPEDGIVRVSYPIMFSN